jgi:hypothetical protein
LILAAVAVAAVALTLGATNSGYSSAQAPTNNEYTVDVDAVAEGIQAAIEVPVGSDFEVAWVVTDSPDLWIAEQGNMQWDPSMVSFVSGPLDANLGGATLCGGTVGADYAYRGCAIPAGDCGAACTGVTRTMVLRCDAPGTSALHLQTSDKVGVATGTNFALAVGGVGDPCETGRCLDASVTCVGEAQPTAMPTDVPASPLATATGTVLAPAGDTEPEEKGVSAAAVAGIVIGGVLVLVLIAGGLYLGMKRVRRGSAN